MSSIFIYHVSIPNLTSVQLIFPDLVLVTLLIGLSLLLVVMFAGIWLVAVMVQSSLLSHAKSLKSAFWLCWMGLRWSISSPLSPIGIFILSIYALESAVYNLSFLSCSDSTVCVKFPLIIHIPFFISSWMYCSVVNGVMHICLVFHIISHPFLSFRWCKISL